MKSRVMISVFDMIIIFIGVLVLIALSVTNYTNLSADIESGRVFIHNDAPYKCRVVDYKE